MMQYMYIIMHSRSTTQGLDRGVQQYFLSLQISIKYYATGYCMLLQVTTCYYKILQVTTGYFSLLQRVLLYALGIYIYHESIQSQYCREPVSLGVYVRFMGLVRFNELVRINGYHYFENIFLYSFVLYGTLLYFMLHFGSFGHILDIFGILCAYQENSRCQVHWISFFFFIEFVLLIGIFWYFIVLCVTFCCFGVFFILFVVYDTLWFKEYLVYMCHYQLLKVIIINLNMVKYTVKYDPRAQTIFFRIYRLES